ncbi:hypothetical protein [Hyphomonas sp. ND6WE1B]|uniref:hypothetical protein n=1 Tax=Hyphomonas sp. ND6WE1B TaxID=1848191 RepID=UPI0011127CCF|nr:hypothetical protein [Hyphomonas sp. ND6WE1B]
MARNNTSPFVLPRDIIRMAFPQGTQWTELAQKPAETAWNEPPNWAPDLFGIAAYLLEHAGAYHHFTPGGATLGLSDLEMTLSDEERHLIQEEARLWREDPLHRPDFVRAAWKEIYGEGKSVCSALNKDKTSLPGWWRDALMLAAYADETCVHVGHTGANGPDVTAEWIQSVLVANANAEITEANGSSKSHPDQVSISEGPFSICLAASEDMFCVQPKGRTPDIGCTIRSMSQNLSLMPPTGVLQTGWRIVPSDSLGSPDKTPFNCLFVPYPYKINPKSFKVAPGGKKWNWFDVEQDWLPRNGADQAQFLEFIERLLQEASKGSGGTRINAIVFPEYALTWQLHEKLVAFIQERIKDEAAAKNGRIFSSLEFVISGSSSNCDGHSGNFVLTTQLVDVMSGAVKWKTAVHSSRNKHHRWQVTPQQIDEYNLQEGFDDVDGKALLPAYWERISIPRRRLHTHQFRDQSVLTTLICEDLARAEPVHKYVRAVGPNIIFVLLMDGCQLEQRWPARYAMGLSEDPGSAVVTLTSRALISQSNAKRQRDGETCPKWSVALARNPGGPPMQIPCPKHQEGVVLKFEAHPSEELTLDGRFKNTGWTWALGDQFSVGLERTGRDKELLEKIVKDYENAPEPAK